MTIRLSLVLLLVISISACAGSTPETLGVQSQNSLGQCPDSPNCVSSADPRESHNVAPLQLSGDIASSWTGLRAKVEQLEGTVVMKSDERYLHAESTSSLMRYVDDLELLLDPATGRVDVRSASRVGYGDMGVNAARVEALRNLLSDAGVSGP